MRVKAADIAKLQHLLDQPANAPLRKLFEDLVDERDELQADVDQMVLPSELEKAQTAATACKELVQALFEFLYEGEHGGLNEHIYRKEKLRLWRWADSLDIEVSK